jgi:hypothetical protein
VNERAQGAGTNALDGPGGVAVDLTLVGRGEKGPQMAVHFSAVTAPGNVCFTRLYGGEPFTRLSVAPSPARRVQLGAQLEF